MAHDLMLAGTKLHRGQCEVVFSGNPKQAHEIRHEVRSRERNAVE